MVKSLLFVPQSLFFFLVGITGVAFLIGFHELGHFVFCKIFKVSTPTFSIGFGPRILTKKIGATEFSLSAIPLGGYVEMAGSAEIGQGEQKQVSRTDEYSFLSKPYYQKVLIMLGGISFNILFAFLAFCLIFWLGVPKSEFMSPINKVPIISAITKDSNAEKAGLKINDTIIAINGQPITGSIKKLVEIIRPLANQTATLTVEREGNPLELAVPIDARTILGQMVGFLPVAYQTIQLPGYPFFESIQRGYQFTYLWIKNAAFIYTHLLRSRDFTDVAGPLTIFSESIKGAEQGFKIFLALLAIISISLAILNLIPLPIFDGGQVLIYTIEAIIRRQIPLRIKEYIFIASWLAIITLIIYMSAKDIIRMMGPHLQSILKYFGK